MSAVKKMSWKQDPTKGSTLEGPHKSKQIFLRTVQARCQSQVKLKET